MIQIYTTDAGEIEKIPEETLHILSERSRAFWEKKQNKAALESAAAELLLVTALRRILGEEMVALPLEFGIMEGGKPYLLHSPEIRFNLSHSHGLILCAISDQEIGADIQIFMPERKSLFKHVLSPAEAEVLKRAAEDHEREAIFYPFWAAKEAYLKLIGSGIRRPMNTVETLGDYIRDMEPLNQESTDPGQESRELPVRIYRPKLYPDCAAAICVREGRGEAVQTVEEHKIDAKELFAGRYSL